MAIAPKVSTTTFVWHQFGAIVSDMLLLKTWHNFPEPCFLKFVVKITGLLETDARANLIHLNVSTTNNALPLRFAGNKHKALGLLLAQQANLGEYLHYLLLPALVLPALKSASTK